MSSVEEPGLNDASCGSQSKRGIFMGREGEENISSGNLSCFSELVYGEELSSFDLYEHGHLYEAGAGKMKGLSLSLGKCWLPWTLLGRVEISSLMEKSGHPVSENRAAAHLVPGVFAHLLQGARSGIWTKWAQRGNAFWGLVSSAWDCDCYSGSRLELPPSDPD